MGVPKDRRVYEEVGQDFDKVTSMMGQYMEEYNMEHTAPLHLGVFFWCSGAWKSVLGFVCTSVKRGAHSALPSWCQTNIYAERDLNAGFRTCSMAQLFVFV
eukprot:1158515-Pelagomonas_calceolata.AAC.12